MVQNCAAVFNAAKSAFGGAKPTWWIYDGVDAPDGIDVPKWRC